MRGCEVQDGKRGGAARGALHDHFLFRTMHPVDEKRLRRLAIRAGFGHSVRLNECAPGSKREARYVSKNVAEYVTKATDQRRVVPWVANVELLEDWMDTSTGEVHGLAGDVVQRSVPARYRTWSMSRGWGLKMAQVKAEAAARARAIRDEAEQVERGAVSLLQSVLGVVVIVPDESPPAPS